MHDTVINVKDKIARHDAVEVYGARVHNLKNIDVCIPRHSLTVITGMSGSGKSSLAFDTLLRGISSVVVWSAPTWTR